MAFNSHYFHLLHSILFSYGGGPAHGIGGVNIPFEDITSVLPEFDPGHHITHTSPPAERRSARNGPSGSGILADGDYKSRIENSNSVLNLSLVNVMKDRHNFFLLFSLQMITRGMFILIIEYNLYILKGGTVMCVLF